MVWDVVTRNVITIDTEVIDIILPVIGSHLKSPSQVTYSQHHTDSNILQAGKRVLSVWVYDNILVQSPLLSKRAQVVINWLNTEWIMLIKPNTTTSALQWLHGGKISTVECVLCLSWVWWADVGGKVLHTNLMLTKAENYIKNTLLVLLTFHVQSCTA